MTKIFSFELFPNSEFDFDLLPQFSKEHGVSHHIDFDDGYIITFSSDNLDHLQEVSDQLSFLQQTTIS
jgi:hypothetical protein